MVIEAGVAADGVGCPSPATATGRGGPSVDLRGARPAEPPERGDPHGAGPRAAGRPARARSTSSPTARSTRRRSRARVDDAAGPLGRRSAAAPATSGITQLRRPAELLRRVRLPGVPVGRQLLRRAQTLPARADARRRDARRADARRSSPQVRRAVMVPFTVQTRRRSSRLRLDVRDDLAADNAAYAVLPPPRKIARPPREPRQPVPGEGAQTDPQVMLEVEDARRVLRAAWSGFDVVVRRQRDRPRRSAPAASSSSTSARRRRAARGRSARLEQPVIMDWDRTHPDHALQSTSPKVAIEDAHARAAAGRRARRWWRPWAARSSTCSRSRERKAVFFGFDLFKTDFPLRVAFPLILSNSLRWLHPAGLDQLEPQLAAGPADPAARRARRDHGAP